jgi:hypothetical protein
MLKEFFKELVVSKTNFLMIITKEERLVLERNVK